MEKFEIRIKGGSLEKQHESDLCFDLRARSIYGIEDSYSGRLLTVEEAAIHPYAGYFQHVFPFVFRRKSRCCIDTGLVIDFPDNVGAIIKPRSGLAYKFGIDVLAGVIDPGYRDSVKVILINHGSMDFTIEENDRIAQLWPVVVPYSFQFIGSNAVSDTSRGLGGFGSTGVA